MNTSPELIGRLATVADADPESFTFLRASQNSVYEFRDRDGNARILRLTADSHRRRDEILDELEWLRHLHASGIDVCPPLVLPCRALIHTLDLPEGECHATIFVKAPGCAITRDDLGENFYFLHGKSLGRLHAHSSHHPNRFLCHRRRYYQERYFCEDLEVFIPGDVRSAIRDSWHQLRFDLSALPLDPNDFGPSHLDLGYSNFHRDGDRLWLYDFDNCALAPYACDIAVALYGSLFNLLRCDFPGDRAAFAHPRTSQNLETVLPAFRAGYESTHRWKGIWETQFPLWFEFAYFRSVVHAFRMQHPVTNPQAKAALDADIENLLRRQPPIRYGSKQTRR